jgi:hypothetical protein
MIRVIEIKIKRKMRKSAKLGKKAAVKTYASQRSKR